MLRTFLIFLVSAVMLASCGTSDVQSHPADGSEYGQNSLLLDSLCNEVEMSIGTFEGLLVTDEYIRAARECDDMGQYLNGLSMKMTNYLALDMHDRLFEFSDSVAAELKNLPYYYYYTQYLLTVSYVNQGKYRMAIQLAQELYDSGKELARLDLSKDSTYRVNQPAINMCNALSIMGMANHEMGQYDAAMSSYDECIQLALDNGLAPIILDVSAYRLETVKALSDTERMLRYAKEYEDDLNRWSKGKSGSDIENVSLGIYYFNLHVAYAHIYSKMNDADNVKANLDKAQSIADSLYITDMSIADFNGVKAEYYHLIGQHITAVAYADSAVAYWRDVNMPVQEVGQLKLKFEALHSARLFSQEYSVTKRILALSDSISNAKYNSSMDEMMTMKNVDKLESEAAALSAQRQLWIMVAISAVLLAVVGVVLINRHRDREKQKILSQQKQLLEEEVARQTAELREQKNEIEQKNRDITDSINYAERIQSSILPDLEVYRNYGVEGAFAFLIPCNIVSGDFYWATHHGDDLVIACSDCTGHGVPGAFVSMIGSTSLNEIASQPVLPDPGSMLEELDKNVFKVLGQSGGEARDGMDISIISYNPKTRIVKGAGAKRPVYLVRKDGVLEEFKGTKRSIGDTDESSRAKLFETFEFEVAPGDTVYMCSDGIGDQFGGQEMHGPNGKRWMSGGVKKMLMRIVQAPITEQRALVEKEYWAWRGTCPQLDDISLVGVRF